MMFKKMPPAFRPFVGRVISTRMCQTGHNTRD